MLKNWMTWCFFNSQIYKNDLIQKILSLRNHAGFWRYFNNTVWMMCEQVLRIIAGLLVGIWVARYLGPKQFGIFNYALAFTSIFGGIAKLGLDGIIVRELVHQPKQYDVYLGTAFWLKVLGALIVMALLVAVVPLTSNDATTNRYIFIIAAGLVFQSFEVVSFYFEYKVLGKVVSICKIIQLTLSSSIKIYFVLTQADLLWFVVVTLFDTVSLAVSYVLAYWLLKNANFYRQFDFRIAKQLLRDSWPLIFSAIVVTIYMRIDQIMIKYMLGEYEVGIYSAAIRLSEVFYFIPTLITASVFPALLNAKKKDQKIYLLRLQNLYTLMIWIAIAIAISVTLLGDRLVVFLYGEHYYSAGKVLKLHIWSLPFIFLLISSGKWLISEGFTKLALYRNIAAALINIFLNLTLIPKIGIVGAAWSTLASFFISSYLFDITSRKTVSQFVIKTEAFLLKIK